MQENKMNEKVSQDEEHGPWWGHDGLKNADDRHCVQRAPRRHRFPVASVLGILFCRSTCAGSRCCLLASPNQVESPRSRALREVWRPLPRLCC